MLLPCAPRSKAPKGRALTIPLNRTRHWFGRRSAASSVSTGTYKRMSGTLSLPSGYLLRHPHIQKHPGAPLLAWAAIAGSASS